MLPNPNDLQYFIAVGETKNISRAAERLGISQPSLSVAIRRLEDNLGAPLIVRTKTGVQLTETGLRLSQQAQQLLDDWQNIRSDALKHHSEIRGRYVIGCHPSVAKYTLGHVLPPLLEEHEALEVSIKHDLSRRITEDIISFKIDIGLVINPVQHPDLVIRNLLRDEVKLWTHQKPSRIQQPNESGSTLICDPDLLQTQEILKKLAKKKVHFDRVIAGGNLEVIAKLVESKAGVGILPTRVAQMSSSKLVPLGDDLPFYKDQLSLIYRADIPRSAGLKEIIKVIERQIQ